LHLLLHSEIPQQPSLRRQWNELVRGMECPEVFYTYEWALAMSHAYRGSLAPLLFLAYEQDSLIGVASLATDHSKSASFLAASTADYCDFISLPENRSQLVNLVLNEMRRLNLPSLVLANLPENSSTLRALRLGAAEYGYSLFSRPAYRCAQVSLSSLQERQSAKQAMRSKTKLRRRTKALSRDGPLYVRHWKLWNEIAEILPELQQAQIARFSASGRTSNLAQPERQTFLAELTDLLANSGWMALSCLCAGDQRIAWNFGFRFAGNWFWYQPAFDIRYQQYDPGLCLLVKIIEEACDTPEIDRVDLGLGTESYKERFATSARQTLHVTISASAVHHLTTALRYHAASAINSSPVLAQWVRRLLGRPTSGAVHA
jgi:CelD/BcsL family acetyltransferase involved in cellulose biosynthesis